MRSQLALLLLCVGAQAAYFGVEVSKLHVRDPQASGENDPSLMPQCKEDAQYYNDGEVPIAACIIDGDLNCDVVYPADIQCPPLGEGQGEGFLCKGSVTPQGYQAC
ncbi:hypothetical protein BST61_g7728 [Cercospora zeina]